MIESVNIKDLSNIPRFSTPINEGSKRKFLLMKEDYITLKFSLDSPMYFQLGDNIDNELGIFELIDLYKPTYNTTTGAYDYELRLDAYYWKWKNKKFFYTPETTGREAAWNLTATLDTNLNVFLDNLKALGYKFRDLDFTWDIDSTVENTSKLVSYDNVNLIDALTQMAETWECEWWIDNHKICFGRCEYSSPVDFKVGDLSDSENVNVNSMQRSDSQATYATRVYAFGSTRNIPASYRKSLIFDVKKVDGRDIADTERRLDIKFFPLSSLVPKKTIKGDINIDKGIANGNQQFKCTVINSLVRGTYSVLTTSVPFAISGIVNAGSEYFPPKGTYNYQLDLCYIKSGASYKVCSISGEHYIADNTINGFKDTLNLPSSIYIEENADSLEAVLTVKVQAETQPRGVSARIISFNLVLENQANSATISVTFLSGLNEEKIFDAIYNPDFLCGDVSNVIRLPEGVTASLGDRYTINNIIKGKVPDNYFSKDDKELTLNGVVQKRLMLPEGIPYVDAYRYNPVGERIDIGDERYDNPDNVEMPITEAIEEIVVLEDEYPKYIGNTDIVPKPTIHDEIDEDKKPTGNQYPIYTFKDTGLKKFTSDFLLDELRLIFQTGKLAGLDFALTLKESDSTGTTFEIVRNEDYGRYLPDDVLFPQAAHTEDNKPVPADTYILHGFDTAFISEQMLPDSEQALLEKAKDYVKKSMIDPSTYDCEMDCEYIYNDGNIRTFEVGAKVNLINKAYFPSGRQSRIIGLEWPLDIPYDHPIYTVGETAAYSRIGEIESKLDSLTYKGQTYSGSVVGGGGMSVYVIGVNDKTLPSDRNVFSAKRIINEISERAISRTEDDQAAGLIEFLKGISVINGINTDTLVATKVDIQILNVLDKLIAKSATFSGDISSNDYAEGLIGWLIGKDGHIDAKSLRLRDFLEVPELRYNRVSIVSGEEWNAPGGGIIESADTENGIIYLKLEPGEIAQIEVDDICKATFNNETGFQTAFFRITEKLGDSTFKYVLRSGYAFHPCKAMHFVAYGNFTNEERQRSSYSTQSYVRYLTGVNGWEITKEMIAMQLGDLSSLKLFGIDMTGHSAYLRNIYMTGVIKQISDDGVTESRVPCFKGEWKAGTYYYYDEVTHNGASWLCISDKPTTQEPAEYATDWLEKSAAGKDAVIVNIMSSNGNIFQNGSVATTLTAYVIKGDTDITDSVPASRFSWEKESNNSDTDKIFNETHVGHGHMLILTPDDVWGRATFNCIVSL